MPPRELAALLSDILTSARGLTEITHNRTHEDLATDLAFRWALERGVQNIGEAVFQINKLDPQAAAQLDQHDRVIGCRHVLVHGYFDVNPYILWEIVTIHLGPLVESVRRLQNDTASPNETR